MGGESVGVMDEQLTGITVTPPLDASEVAFLAALGTGPVRDHAGRASPPGADVRRVWPGQPRTTSPWTPCADGCCLVRSAGAVQGPGVAAQWLRFLVGTFLLTRHRVDGGVVVPVRGGPPEVLLVEDGEVFGGLVDPAPDGPVGGWTA